MNKKNKKEIKIIPLLIIFASVSLLISAILILITPQKETIVQNNFVNNNYNQTQTTYKKIDFSGQKIFVPEFFTIFQAKATLNLEDELANKIIREYQLEKDEKMGNYWIKDENFLIKNVFENRWSFDIGSKNESAFVPIVIEEAISQCANFYKKYNLDLSLIAQKNSILYLGGTLEQRETDQKDAVYLQIPFTYELNGFSVFYENENNYPFFCKIDHNYEVRKIVFKDSYQVFEPAREISSLSLDQAVKNIKNGVGSIIDAQSKIANVIDLNWIIEADLYAVEIEYRYDSELKIAYPFYKFSAKLTNSAGINIEAKIITPAVASAAQK